jgi:uncharacterized protein DUF4864
MGTRFYYRPFVRLGWVIMLIALSTSASAAQSNLAGPNAQDWRAIRHTITRQIDAFQRDDAKTAFSYAAPSVRRQFRTPHEFMSMVRTGYSAVYRPRAFRFLDPFTVSGHVIQALEVVTQDDTVITAYYVMERQSNGTWKIAACTLEASAARSV